MGNYMTHATSFEDQYKAVSVTTILPNNQSQYRSINVTDIRVWKMNLLAVYSDKAYLAVSDKIMIYDLCTNSMDHVETIDLQNGELEINQLKFGLLSGDLPILLVVDDGGGVTLIFLDDLHRPLLKFNNNNESTWGCALNYCMRGTPMIAVSANSHEITMWDLQHMSIEEPKKVFKGHKHNIPAIDFSPCGYFMASVSIDCTLKVWNVSTGREMASKPLGQNEWGWGCKWIPSYSVKSVRVSTEEWSHIKHSIDQQYPPQNAPSAHDNESESDSDSDSQFDEDDDFEANYNEWDEGIDEEDESMGEDEEEMQSTVTNDSSDNEVTFTQIMNMISNNSDIVNQIQNWFGVGENSDNGNNNNNNNDHNDNVSLSSDDSEESDDVPDNKCHKKRKTNGGSGEESTEVDKKRTKEEEETKSDQDECVVKDSKQEQEDEEDESEKEMKEYIQQMIGSFKHQLRSAAESTNSYITRHSVCSDFIVYTTFRHIYLCDSSLKVLASLCNALARPLIPVPSYMFQMQRISMVEYIPELSLLIVASQGCAAVLLVRIIKNWETNDYLLAPERTLPHAMLPCPIAGISVTRHISPTPSLTHFKLYILFQNGRLFTYKLSNTHTVGNEEIENLSFVKLRSQIFELL